MKKRTISPTNMEDLDKKVTVDSLINYLQNKVENKVVLNPNVWIEVAVRLNVLQGAEMDKLLELQQQVAKLKIESIESDPKRNVSKAKMFVEATDLYKDMKRQEAKIDRIIEFIRLSKVQARMRDEEYKGQ